MSIISRNLMFTSPVCCIFEIKLVVGYVIKNLKASVMGEWCHRDRQEASKQRGLSCSACDSSVQWRLLFKKHVSYFQQTLLVLMQYIFFKLTVHTLPTNTLGILLHYLHISYCALLCSHVRFKINIPRFWSVIICKSFVITMDDRSKDSGFLSSV